VRCFANHSCTNFFYNSAVQIRFIPTEQDWRNAAQGAPKSGWGWLQFFLTFVPLFFLGGCLGASGFETVGYTCMVASIGIALAAYEVPRFRRRKLIRATPLAHGERIVSIEEKGITVTLPHGHSQYEWRAFHNTVKQERPFCFSCPLGR
jgi:hypothetical protein